MPKGKINDEPQIIYINGIYKKRTYKNRETPEVRRTRKQVANAIITRKGSRKNKIIQDAGDIENKIYGLSKKIKGVYYYFNGLFDKKILGNSPLMLNICATNIRNIENTFENMENTMKLIEYFMKEKVYEPCLKMLQISAQNKLSEKSLYGEMSGELKKIRNEFMLDVFGVGEVGIDIKGRKRNIYDIKKCDSILPDRAGVFQKIGNIECRLYELRNQEVQLNKYFRRCREALQYISNFNTIGNIAKVYEKITNNTIENPSQKVQKIMETLQKRIDVYQDFEGKIIETRDKLISLQKKYAKITARIEDLGLDSMVDYETIEKRNKFSSDSKIRTLQEQKMTRQVVNYVNAAYVSLIEIVKYFNKGVEITQSTESAKPENDKNEDNEENEDKRNKKRHDIYYINGDGDGDGDGEIHGGAVEKANLEDVKILYKNAAKYRHIAKKYKQPDKISNLTEQLQVLYYNYYDNLLHMIKFAAYSPKLIVMRDMGAFTIGRLKIKDEDKNPNMLMMLSPFLKNTLIEIIESNSYMFEKIKKKSLSREVSISNSHLFNDDYLEKSGGAPTSKTMSSFPYILLFSLIAGKGTSPDEVSRNLPVIFDEIIQIADYQIKTTSLINNGSTTLNNEDKMGKMYEFISNLKKEIIKCINGDDYVFEYIKEPKFDDKQKQILLTELKEYHTNKIKPILNNILENYKSNEKIHTWLKNIIYDLDDIYKGTAKELYKDIFINRKYFENKYKDIFSFMRKTKGVLTKVGDKAKNIWYKHHTNVNNYPTNLSIIEDKYPNFTIMHGDGMTVIDNIRDVINKIDEFIGIAYQEFVKHENFIMKVNTNEDDNLTRHMNVLSNDITEAKNYAIELNNSRFDDLYYRNSVIALHNSIKDDIKKGLKDNSYTTETYYNKYIEEIDKINHIFREKNKLLYNITEKNIIINIIRNLEMLYGYVFNRKIVIDKYSSMINLQNFNNNIGDCNDKCNNIQRKIDNLEVIGQEDIYNIKELHNKFKSFYEMTKNNFHSLETEIMKIERNIRICINTHKKKENREKKQKYDKIQEYFNTLKERLQYKNFYTNIIETAVQNITLIVNCVKKIFKYWNDTFQKYLQIYGDNENIFHDIYEMGFYRVHLQKIRSMHINTAKGLDTANRMTYESNFSILDGYFKEVINDYSSISSIENMVNEYVRKPVREYLNGKNESLLIRHKNKIDNYEDIKRMNIREIIDAVKDNEDTPHLRLRNIYDYVNLIKAEENKENERTIKRKMEKNRRINADELNGLEEFFNGIRKEQKEKENAEAAAAPAAEAAAAEAAAAAAKAAAPAPAVAPEAAAIPVAQNDAITKKEQELAELRKKRKQEKNANERARQEQLKKNDEKRRQEEKKQKVKRERIKEITNAEHDNIEELKQELINIIIRCYVGEDTKGTKINNIEKTTNYNSLLKEANSIENNIYKPKPKAKLNHEGGARSRGQKKNSKQNRNTAIREDKQKCVADYNGYLIKLETAKTTFDNKIKNINEKNMHGEPAALATIPALLDESHAGGAASSFIIDRNKIHNSTLFNDAIKNIEEKFTNLKNNDRNALNKYKLMENTLKHCIVMEYIMNLIIHKINLVLYFEGFLDKYKGHTVKYIIDKLDHDKDIYIAGLGEKKIEDVRQTIMNSLKNDMSDSIKNVFGLDKKINRKNIQKTLMELFKKYDIKYENKITDVKDIIELANKYNSLYGHMTMEDRNTLINIIELLPYSNALKDSTSNTTNETSNTTITTKAELINFLKNINDEQNNDEDEENNQSDDNDINMNIYSKKKKELENILRGVITNKTIDMNGISTKIINGKFNILPFNIIYKIEDKIKFIHQMLEFYDEKKKILDKKLIKSFFNDTTIELFDKLYILTEVYNKQKNKEYFNELIKNILKIDIQDINRFEDWEKKILREEDDGMQINKHIKYIVDNLNSKYKEERKIKYEEINYKDDRYKIIELWKFLDNMKDFIPEHDDINSLYDLYKTIIEYIFPIYYYIIAEILKLESDIIKDKDEHYFYFFDKIRNIISNKDTFNETSKFIQEQINLSSKDMEDVIFNPHKKKDTLKIIKIYYDKWFKSITPANNIAFGGGNNIQNTNNLTSNTKIPLLTEKTAKLLGL